MIHQEMIVEIRVLHRRGQSIRQLAQTFEVSRNTVRRYLRGASAQRVERKYVGILEPFKPYITERLEQARPHWISATVLLAEIQAQGYTGEITLIRRFVRAFKPAPIDDPVVRFETAPGQQMQADFVVFRRAPQPLLAFVATLGWSRASFVRFTADERATTVEQCLVGAFEFFGGVPHHVLFDNAKSIVVQRNAYGEGLHRFHPALMELANRYAFSPRLCRPYRAKTKGKVERFNGYLRHQFYIPLMTRLRAGGLVLDPATANVEVSRWLRETANVRTHGTTGLIPAAQLIAEQPSLVPLPRRLPTGETMAARSGGPIPAESLQHPLSVYAQLLERA
jgi:transposase